MNIIPIKLRISWAYLVLGQRPVLVDSGSPGDLPLLERGLQAAGVDPAQLALVIHTHAHYDHCGNTLALQDRGGVPAAIHAADLPSYQAGVNVPLPPSLIARLLAMGGQRYPAPRADVVVTGDLDLRPYGVQGCALHTPGHTPGSLTVVVDGVGAMAGDLLAGGSLFGMFHPTRPNYHPIIDDRRQVDASVARVLASGAPKIYLGHGGPLAREDLAAWAGRH